MPELRHAIFGFLGMMALALVIPALFFRGPAPAPEPETPEDLPDNILVEVVGFEALPEWDTAELAPSLMAFQSSCDFVRANAADFVTDPQESNHWLEACDAVDSAMVAAQDIEVIARSFFQSGFTPIRIRNNDEETGMFTGYYEPQLNGSLRQTEEFSTPLLRRPQDLVMVQLSEFPGDRQGRIAGRVENGRLRPFESREEIEAGVLEDVQPLVWVDDPVDAFFLQIQGSGRVVLQNGQVLRVGYAGANGHPYFPIGRVLVEREILPVEEVSMQSIRDWLAANPGEAEAVMNRNASYIFFRGLNVPDPAMGPIGSAGVPLTPGFSLAVDRQFHALGAPVYVSTTLPNEEPFQRLMVAQDTGGAIRGPIRGDLFFGFGDDATELAGAMRAQGSMWVLVPNAVAEQILRMQAAQATGANVVDAAANP